MKKFLSFIVLIVVAFKTLLATVPPDEGMWLLMFLNEKNYEAMKSKGLNLSPEDIYSINHSSIKDAVVGLGNEEMVPDGFFCSGEIVSDQGLVLTNHHCAFESIQIHSSVKNDYIANGFWARNIGEELRNENLTMSILVSMEDVTAKVLKDITPDMNFEKRKVTIEKEIAKIEKAASRNKYDAIVKDFFNGNEYYLFVYQTYKDIRLVGAPPSSIGNFGGDTDNWMWPRHTGDFSLFRIYTAPDGSPAEYSENNIPLNPKHFFPISLKGVHKNDFTMIIGFPGETNRYMTSHGVKLAIDESNPAIVKIREKKLSVLREFMNVDPKIKIQYASKYATISNYWKYYIGQTKCIKRWNVYERRKELENEFMSWVNSNANLKEKYGDCLLKIEEAYNSLEKSNLEITYLEEAMLDGLEFIDFSFNFYRLYSILQEQSESDKSNKSDYADFINEEVVAINKLLPNFFKNYNVKVDYNLFVAMMNLYYKDIPKEQQMPIFEILDDPLVKGNVKMWADYVYENSFFVDENRTRQFLKKPDFKKIENDPVWTISLAIIDRYNSIYDRIDSIQNIIDENSRIFLAGLREMKTAVVFYPDANSTLRLTYGTIQDYYPSDAVYCDFRTSANGVVAKEDHNNDEFIVLPRLKKLIKNKDFGQYSEDGVLYTCFLSDNDITGGNSGSPVINGDGELIGIAFDGNWESMSGDIVFETSVQRTISVDIRYVMFIIDKFAEAKNIIDELSFRK